jgi:hypothetical protein
MRGKLTLAVLALTLALIVWDFAPDQGDFFWRLQQAIHGLMQSVLP